MKVFLDEFFLAAGRVPFERRSVKGGSGRVDAQSRVPRFPRWSAHFSAPVQGGFSTSPSRLMHGGVSLKISSSN